jgi:2-dehydro-3-deoxyglucarate aldolase/4-hydroxy-2-oxoheptanedioate aldolase
MRANGVKSTLAAGGVAFGTSVYEFATPGFPRIAASTGIDFIIYDTEHTGWTTETLRPLLAATRATEVVPMVRVSSLDYAKIAGILDIGAMGIMVPTVESGEDARRIVEYASYPPVGRRGAAFGFAHDDFRGEDPVASMRSANAEKFLICLIETAAGVRNADEIAAVEGIDCIWIGHFDLSMSLGLLAQFQHPDYLTAVAQIEAAAKRHDKVLGYTAPNVEEAERKLDAGYRCISYSGDIVMYQQTLGMAIGAMRQIAERR